MNNMYSHGFQNKVLSSKIIMNKTSFKDPSRQSKWRGGVIGVLSPLSVGGGEADMKEFMDVRARVMGLEL